METKQKQLPRSVYNKRLNRLANVVEGIPTTKFDMDFIVGSKRGDFYSYNKDKNKKLYSELQKLVANGQPKSCGYAACAIGHIPLAFPNQFSYHLSDDADDIKVVNIKTKATDWHSAVEFFGLSEREAQYLFAPDSYRVGHAGPKSVSNRIKAFALDHKLPKKFV